jgi:undecaprenyl-diphosphatase
VALVVTVFLTDQVSAHIMKSLFDRVRPCNALTGVLTPDDKPSSFSFPSSHATNMGGSMTFLALAYPPWAWFCVLFAFLVGLSRIYLGVHYPSDVLGGWVLGVFLGWTVWKIVSPWATERLRPAVAPMVIPFRRAKSRKGGRHVRKKR